MNPLLPLLFGLLLSTGAPGGSAAEATGAGPLPELLDVWDYSAPGETQKRFEALVSRAGERGAWVYRAEALTQIARCQGLARRFREGHATLDRLRGDRSADHPRVRIRVALERGRLLRSSGHGESARPQFLTAWEMGRVAGEDFLAVDAAHMLALLGSLDAAATWTERGRTLALESEDERVLHWLGPLHNNLGWSMFEAGRHAEALEQFEWSRAGYAAESDTTSALIARYAKARTLRALGRTGEAVQEQESVRDVFHERGEEDAYVLEELAEGYAILGRVSESRKAASRALSLFSSDDWVVANEPERLERLRVLSGEAASIPPRR